MPSVTTPTGRQRSRRRPLKTLAASVAATGWHRSSRWLGCLHAHGRRVRRRADRPNPAPVCHRARELRSSWHTGNKLRLWSSAFSRSSRVHGLTGRRAGLGLAALAGVVDDRAEGRQRRAMPSPSVPTRRSSSLKTGVKPRNCPCDRPVVLRRFATATATSILRHTSTHNQINAHRRLVLSGRAG